MPSGGEPLAPNQIKTLVKGMKDILRRLATTYPKTKTALYAGLGLRLTYHPDTDVVEVEARPQDARSTERVGKAFATISTRSLRGELALAG